MTLIKHSQFELFFFFRKKVSRICVDFTVKFLTKTPRYFRKKAKTRSEVTSYFSCPSLLKTLIIITS